MPSGGAVAYHNMSPSVFLLFLFVTVPLLPHSALSNPLGFFINCGGTNEVTVDSLKYIPDGSYTKVGTVATINKTDLLPTLTTLRYFPNTSSRKFCYTFPVIKGNKYLVKTIYYYGEFDGGKQPPVFDQIIEGTKWSVVNTTEDYAKGLSSYYEVVVVSHGKKLSVCLARNEHTGSSSPFISALEVKSLDGSLYNPIDFSKYALVTVSRHHFGGEDIISFPDDKFNRMWQPFKDENPVVISNSNISSSDFWNLPPVKAISSGITTSKGKTLEIQWPPVLLPSTYYYISLYFQDNRNPSPFSWRTFDVAINGHTFYSNLNATSKGVTVYAAQWPLSGQTKITLTPSSDMPVGPVINAGEVYQILPLSGRTQTRDIIAMEDLAKSLQNPPRDWNGDPCRPKGNSWTGVTCSDQFVSRVIALSNGFAVNCTVQPWQSYILNTPSSSPVSYISKNSVFRNLTNGGIAGTLPPSIGNLTALSHLWVGGNKLTGTIPDLHGLKELQTLHLENNKFEGSLPPSIEKLPKLHEISSDLQHKKLDAKSYQTLK